MHQIMEWIVVSSPFLAIGILCWYANRQHKRTKLIGRGKYEFVEQMRREMGKPAIDWRGSLAKYNEDVKHEDWGLAEGDVPRKDAVER